MQLAKRSPLVNLLMKALKTANRTWFETGWLEAEFGFAPSQARAAIRSLIESGDLIRVQRGRYLLRPTDLQNRLWSPTDALALKALILDKGGLYQFCGPVAFQSYGWDDQIPNQTQVYNTLYSGDRTVGSVSLTLIKVESERLGGSIVKTTPDGVPWIWPTRARALVDAVQDWSRFNSLPRAYDWIRMELQRDDAFAADLVEMTLRFANQGSLRRIGRLLEDEGSPIGLVRKLQRKIAPSTSFIPWDPTRPKQGSVDRRWGVVFNHGA